MTPNGKQLFIGHDAKTGSGWLKKLMGLPHKLKRGRQLTVARENRTKREAKPIGADLIKGKHTREQDLAATNPNFVDGRYGIWEYNCQRCVTAYEARRRGIDVEALPLPVPVTQQWKDQMSHSDGWASAFRNGSIIDCSASSGTAACSKVIKAMKDMPDGARCAVQTIWKGNGGGHVFIAEKINGNVVFVDPQQHGSPDQSNYQWSGNSNGRKTHIMRLDNLKFSAKVKECCKGVPR